ncbi:hypothetical protein CANCADRAFT_1113 [Tortispora caseinolytica NRRL Y-17796]|uniref:Chitin synthase export chaperone n=1 Tax=Tortispora caseinolytica NRRL Y-17796 TaxID=767744 RepID=A0A1E4TL88_9ASCO|nr:hypothetical protein CANCADRAFT_1113 [Tortispora caseinolytica NRRL Y-17796]
MGFGSFDFICSNAALPLCLLVDINPNGDVLVQQAEMLAQCYSRTIELANTVIFQTGNAFISIGALIMVGIMILNIKSKYTAVGRLEMLSFFYMYGLLTFLSLCVDSGVIPTNSSSYPYFVALQAGFSSGVCWCLMLTGFVGFQLYEDGTRKSIYTLWLSSILYGAITFIIALVTFKNWGGYLINSRNTTALFVVLYMINIILCVIYVISQIILVLFTIDSKWPLGVIILGSFFFVVGQVLLYAFSSTLCERMKHYLDGLFFATLCNLLAVMMIYKLWDSITAEDLEFSVANKENMWDVRQQLESNRPFMDSIPYADSVEYQH